MKLLNVFTLTLRVVCFENRRDKKRGGGRSRNSVAFL